MAKRISDPRRPGRIEMTESAVRTIGNGDCGFHRNGPHRARIYEAIGNVGSRILRRVIDGALQNLAAVPPEASACVTPSRATNFRLAATPFASFTFLRRMCRWSSSTNFGRPHTAA